VIDITDTFAWREHDIYINFNINYSKLLMNWTRN